MGAYMRKLILVLVFCLLFVPTTDKIQAQSTQDFKVGDKILVLAPQIAVYVHPQAQSVLVEELTTGMVTRVLKIQKDNDGTIWLYINDSGHGWIQAHSTEAILYS